MFRSLKTMFRSAPKVARPAKRTNLRLECLEARVTPSSANTVAVAGHGNHVFVDGSLNIVVLITNHSSAVVLGSQNVVVIV